MGGEQVVDAVEVGGGVEVAAVGAGFTCFVVPVHRVHEDVLVQHRGVVLVRVDVVAAGEQGCGLVDLAFPVLRGQLGDDRADLAQPCKTGQHVRALEVEFVSDVHRDEPCRDGRVFTQRQRRTRGVRVGLERFGEVFPAGCG